MPPRRNIIYRDALQDDADLNIILQSFRALNVNQDPAPAPAPAPNVTLTPPELPRPPRRPTPAPPPPAPPPPARPPPARPPPARPPPARPPPAPQANADDEEGYWEALRKEGDEAFWAEACDAADQVDDSEPDYIVSVGRETGPIHSWNEAKDQVNRISGCVHQGFESRRDAERAYFLAYALGCVRVLPHRNSTAPPPLVAAPTPLPLLHSFSQVSDDFLGAEWHVVFQGRRPGVYPAWHFVASQTQGVSCAIYKKYLSRQAAQSAFERAQRRGEVETLT